MAWLDRVTPLQYILVVGPWLTVIGLRAWLGTRGVV